MKDRTIVSPQDNAGHWQGLQVGHAVEVRRGELAETSGVLIGLRGDSRCLIELDVLPRGVVLVIDCAAVKERPANAGDEQPPTPAADEWRKHR